MHKGTYYHQSQQTIKNHTILTYTIWHKNINVETHMGQNNKITLHLAGVMSRMLCSAHTTYRNLFITPLHYMCAHNLRISNTLHSRPLIIFSHYSKQYYFLTTTVLWPTLSYLVTKIEPTITKNYPKISNLQNTNPLHFKGSIGRIYIPRSHYP